MLLFALHFCSTFGIKPSAHPEYTQSLLVKCVFKRTVPESPRWLIIKKNKYIEASKTFKRIAKSNGKSPNCLDQFELQMEEKSVSRTESNRIHLEIDKLNPETQTIKSNENV